MNTKQNLHVHSTYCDGKHTPREILETAIQKGFGSIGFSGHSYMEWAPEFSMSQEGTAQYVQEIARLKREYADRITVFCGLEMDMFSTVDLTPYDYVIGSVHYIRRGTQKIGFDRARDRVVNVIDTYFGGDGMAYAKEYYALLATLPQYGRFDIIGHFDLITKHQESGALFDEDAKAYRHAAIEAAEALRGSIPFFEVNTGAIARGYRTTPYPAPFLLKELHRLGFGAVISSDCHHKDMLDCHYEEAAELLRMCGFRERYILDNGGFRAVSL